MDYPKRWSGLFSYHNEKINEGITRVFADDSSQTFGILLIPNHESKEIIHNTLSTLLSNLSDGLRKKLLLQQIDSIHFSVQWCDRRKIKGERKVKVLNDLIQCIDSLSTIEGEFIYPFLGSAGLYGLMKTDHYDDLKNLRVQLASLFNLYNLKPGVPVEDYDLVYSSLVRYVEQLSKSDLNELAQLEEQSMVIRLDEVVITFNDKLMSSANTEVLYQKKF